MTKFVELYGSYGKNGKPIEYDVRDIVRIGLSTYSDRGQIEDLDHRINSLIDVVTNLFTALYEKRILSDEDITTMFSCRTADSGG